ncbi:MAG TPA: hypothetical protein DDZ41_03900, partial [Flavobacterium sp.]|nr:hypothetical protein [Flavobacterium sp.]
MFSLQGITSPDRADILFCSDNGEKDKSESRNKLQKKMNISKILEIVSFTLPSLITGGVAYFLFISHFKDQH